MLLDAQERYSSSQALTATAASTNLIDHLADRNLGVGHPVVVLIQLDVVATDGDADETYVAAWQTDDNSSFSSAATLASLTITRGDVAGTRYVAVAAPDATFERYTRINYTLGGTTPTVTLSAWMLPLVGLENTITYPDNINPLG